MSRKFDERARLLRDLDKLTFQFNRNEHRQGGCLNAATVDTLEKMRNRITELERELVSLSAQVFIMEDRRRLYLGGHDGEFVIS